MTTDTDNWFLRGHAAASILFNDPVWAEQTYQMDRGERVRGDYDPPLPTQAVDDLRARQQRMNTLEELMAAQGCTEVPPVEQHGAWAEVDDTLRLAGRLLDRHGVRWVPATLMAKFRELYHTPLPTSAELRG